jgi:hypothetical protein
MAFEKKAVVNDKERYMMKLAGAAPNKLEDTRFIFMGNNSPEQVGYSQAKKQWGHIPVSFVVAGNRAFYTQIILGLVQILNGQKQPNNQKGTSAAVILRYMKCATTCLIVNISTTTARMMDTNLIFLCDKGHYEACLHLQQSVNPQHAADE